MALDLWGDEAVVTAEVKKPKQRQRSVPERGIRRPSYLSESRDIDGWFRENMPQSLDECADLRKTLRTERRTGNYDSERIVAQTGRKLIRVRGPAGTVMIIGPAARKLFNQKISNRENYLQVIKAQFGVE
jgi:hypothetical protein